MVRLKTRWLIVRIDFKDDPVTFPSRFELSKLLREALTDCFGLAAGDSQIRIKWMDDNTRLILFRVPRDMSRQMQAALTLTSMHNTSLVAWRVLSIHGSARIAKQNMIERLKEWYRDKLLQLKAQGVDDGSRSSDPLAALRDVGMLLEATVASVQHIDS